MSLSNWYGSCVWLEFVIVHRIIFSTNDDSKIVGGYNGDDSGGGDNDDLNKLCKKIS